MKILTYRNINLILLFAFIFIAIQYSCNKNSHSVNLLIQARNIMEDEPTNALILLDSISDPETMGKDNYMQYVVANVQAKYKLYKGVANDTLIFEAQKYFDKRNDAQNAMLAHFYAGGVWNDRQKTDKMLECLFRAEYYAKQTNDNAWNGRIQNNIADIYYIQDMMDSAIVRYHCALDYYKNEKGIDSYKSGIYNFIGGAYEEVNEIDSAFLYYSKGLDLAKKMNSLKDEAIFTHNLGIAHREKGNFDKATEYFHKSLAQTTQTKDSLRTYISLSIMYNKKHQIDSVQYYNNKIAERLSEITYNYTLRGVYQTLSDYNRKSGNYEEALRYNDLREEANQQIIESNYSEKLLDIGNKYRLSLKDKELESQRARLYVFVIIVIATTLGAYFIRRGIRKRKALVEKNKLLEVECELQKKKINNLTFLQNIHRNIVSEWRNINKEVSSLTKKHEVEEKPDVFKRVELMMENLKVNTNTQLIEWAKDFLRTLPSGEKAIAVLEDKELLFLMVCYSKYTTRDMAFILGVVPAKQNFDLRRLGLRGKLKEAGVPDEDIKEIVFSEAV